MTAYKLLFLIFFVSSTVYSQSKIEIDKEAISTILSQFTSDDTPGMAVGILKDGEIVYENYLGIANMEHQVNIDKNTRFNIASNAKQFTALSILKLADQGKISLEDDIRKYVPGIYKNIKDPITINQLINHTSGIRDYCDLIALTGGAWWQEFIDNDDVIEMMEDQVDLNFKPGTDYTYSNTNYILLAEVVKKVTEQKFRDYTKTMFEELGMPDTKFQSHYAEIIPNRARPYGNWGVWRDEPTITEVHGDGALYTTLRDQLQWEKIVQANDGKLISKDLLNKSQSPIDNSFSETYGYGLEFRSLDGLDYKFHDGVTSAYSATFLRFPTKGMSIVVMGNSRNVPANYIAWQIANLVLGLESGSAGYPGNPENVEDLNSLALVLGNYQNDDGSIIRITEKNGSLYRELYQRDPDKLINERGALFEYERIKGLKMNFENIGSADQQFTLYKSTQPPTIYRKISDLIPTSFDRKGLDGRFYNEETGTEIILKHVDGDTYALTKNGREREAKLVLEDYVRMMDSYHIKIMRDDKNEIVGLNVRNKRIKNVIFKKTI